MSHKEMKAAVKREDGLMHPVISGLLGCRKGLPIQHHNLLSLGPCPTACLQLRNCSFCSGGRGLWCS